MMLPISSSLLALIVATAAMILVEEGRLGLDDPVSDYLPAFGSNPTGKVKTAVTMQRLFP